MLYGLSNILKRETPEGRQEFRTADQEGVGLDLSDEMAQTGSDRSLDEGGPHERGISAVGQRALDEAKLDEAKRPAPK
jgi:hypothetical protein